jgi:hypothetical protein
MFVTSGSKRTLPEGASLSRPRFSSRPRPGERKDLALPSLLYFQGAQTRFCHFSAISTALVRGKKAVVNFNIHFTFISLVNETAKGFSAKPERY